MPNKTEVIISKLLSLESNLNYVKENMVTKNEMNNLVNNLDKFMKQVDHYYKEMLSLKNRVDRLEEYINLIAQKVGVQLDR